MEIHQAKRILIIDDNPAVCEMMRMLLESNGYHAFISRDGLDGILKARQESPDLIILDVMLPGIDGHKVCRMIKFDNTLKNIPVIMVTSRNSETDVQISQECGADDFIAKATGTEAILDGIRRLIPA